MYKKIQNKKYLPKGKRQSKTFPAIKSQRESQLLVGEMRSQKLIHAEKSFCKELSTEDPSSTVLALYFSYMF